MTKQLNQNIQRVSHGFSLVEIAVVLVIVGLIVGGGVSSYNAFVDNAYQNSTDSKLIQTKRAILDYVKVNYYMPCPAADDSGDENRAANGTCTTVKGFVPYNAIGRSRAESSDDYSNVFAYGINEDADDLTAMTNYANNPLSGEPEGTEEASYFANNQAIQARLVSPDTGIAGAELPFFGLETPVTAGTNLVGYTDLSYRVCKKYSTNALCTDVADYEVKNIPAVIVAFNENGSGVDLTNNCAGNNHSQQELENCNNDLALMRHVFKEGEFDDQIATISAYEIKQQVLDRLSGLQLDPGDPGGSGGANTWENYDIILNKDFENTNELNVADSDRNTYLITGDVTANGNIGLKDESDVLSVGGSIDVANVINAGGGVDLLTVNDEEYSGLSGFQTVAGLVSGFEYICNDTECYDVATGEIITPEQIAAYTQLEALLEKIDSDLVSDDGSCRIEVSDQGDSKKNKTFTWYFLVKNAGENITITASDDATSAKDDDRVAVSNEGQAGNILYFDVLNPKDAGVNVTITVSSDGDGCTDSVTNYVTN